MTKNRPIKTLINMANELYEDESLRKQNINAVIAKWLEVFSPLELASLWLRTCIMTEKNPFGANYDDEVYEALNVLGYWNTESEE